MAALSGPVDPERLAAGLDALRDLGYEPVLAPNLASRHGLFAGNDDERLSGLDALVADPAVRAILFARGGHGLLRLLPRLDWAHLGRIPRTWMGYSDVVPLLLGLVARCGLVTFHGPMVAADLARGLEDAEREAFLAALGGERGLRIPAPMLLRSGSASGPLMGGCLSLLVHLVGTPYLPSLDGAILFWEDVNEPWYRLDRMLTHLSLSGTLARISGMVIGDVATVEGPAEEPTAWLASARELADDLGIPAAAGVPAGHRAPNLALPLGLEVHLDADRGEIATLVTGR